MARTCKTPAITTSTGTGASSRFSRWSSSSTSRSPAGRTAPSGRSRRRAHSSLSWASSSSRSRGASRSRWSPPSSPRRSRATAASSGGPTALAGSLLGTWKYLSCVVNIAAYPALVADYLGQVVPGSAHGHGGRHDGAAVVRQLRRAERRRVGRGGARRRVPRAIRAHDGDGGAHGAAEKVGGAGSGEEGLEGLLQHSVLEPQLLGQRQHHGRRGGPAGAHVPAGTGRGGSADRCQLPVAAHGGDRRHGRAAGGVGERIPGRRGRHNRRCMAQVLDRGWRGTVVHRHVRSPAEQRRVPAPGHGGPGPPPVRLRAPRHRVQHTVGRHRRLRRHHPVRLLPRLRRRRRHRQLPLAARVRGVPLAPREPAGAQAALPRAAPAAGARRHVRRAVGVPGLRERGRRDEGVRARRRAHGAWSRGARRDEGVQGQEVAQVQRRRDCCR